MEYSNPEIPEGINTSQSHPLKEFLILTVGVIGSLLLLVTLLVIVVDYFADKIPFEWEQSFPLGEIIAGDDKQTLPPYLQEVSRKVIQQIELPEGMSIRVHYVNDETVNAFATLGGHVVLYRGLLEKLRYEDELATVIAHEVAHVKYRHPILSASHGVVVGLVLSIITSSGDDAVGNLLGTTGMVSMMKFSRDFEREADEEAVSALVNLYGHADGAIGLFEIFKTEMNGAPSVEFLSTHPLTDSRIAETRKAINAYSRSSQPRQAIPETFKSWLEAEKKKQISEDQPGDEATNPVKKHKLG